MSQQKKTPGVYVKETPTLAPSVGEVASAIPVFIGYTENEVEKTNDLPTPIKVASMLQYQEVFGGPYIGQFEVTIDGETITEIIPPETSYLMVPSLELYFKNGGGPCYIISLGKYNIDETENNKKKDFENALLALEKEDEPTLILLTDAVNLLASNYHELTRQALKLCADTKDRFAILDVLNYGDDGNELKRDKAVEDFRDGVGADNLMYGAAYYPYLKTTLTHPYTDSSVKINGYIDQIGEYLTDENGVRFIYNGLKLDTPRIEIKTNNQGQAPIDISTANKTITVTINNGKDSVTAKELLKAWDQVEGKGMFDIEIAGTGETPIKKVSLTNLHYTSSIWHHFLPPDIPSLGIFHHGHSDITPPEVEIKENETMTDWISIHVEPGDESATPKTPEKLVISIRKPASGDTVVPDTVLLREWNKVSDKGMFEIRRYGNERTDIGVSDLTPLLYLDDNTETLLKDLRYDHAALYNEIKAQLNTVRVTMPPSAAMAGVYANVDRTIGVWKAPANVGVAGVIEPIQKLNNAEQEDLNVDVNTGKSINVIRNFNGRGVVVWGARTLLGRDNEWRYINVRRLFIMVEESIQKSTNFAVFQPNTPITWLKVRAMIESYLEDLWKAGGLVGQTKEQAYFVNIGLNSTMTEQDILNGYMRVDIGLAASRPAEFIILNFTHKLQEN